jgi:hypothetical protein
VLSGARKPNPDRRTTQIRGQLTEEIEHTEIDGPETKSRKLGEKQLVRIIHDRLAGARRNIIEAGYYLRRAHDEIFAGDAQRKPAH